MTEEKQSVQFHAISRSGESFDRQWKSDITFCQYRSLWNLTICRYRCQKKHHYFRKVAIGHSKNKSVYSFAGHPVHMVKFHEERYWQKVMSLFHGWSKLSPELDFARNCMFVFSTVKIWVVNQLYYEKKTLGVPK